MVLTGLAAVLIIVLMFFPVCPNTQAQSGTTFTPTDKFSIPELNGSIRFSLNGSCSVATLQNGTWIFKDLRLNNSQPLGTLKISAENSNVTILSYRATNTSLPTLRLSYTVQGEGKQTVNLDLQQKSRVNEWSVNLDGQPYVDEGHGWKLLPDDTLFITGATHNATITHYTYVDESNLPFYQRHSVVIITAGVVALTVTIALLIKVKVRR